MWADILSNCVLIETKDTGNNSDTWYSRPRKCRWISHLCI
jgi:hypothetical protein